MENSKLVSQSYFKDECKRYIEIYRQKLLEILNESIYWIYWKNIWYVSIVTNAINGYNARNKTFSEMKYITKEFAKNKLNHLQMIMIKYTIN